MIVEEVARYVNAHGFDRVAIARAIGVEAGVLDEILQGRRPLVAEQYAAICDFLTVPLDTFIRHEGQADHASQAAGSGPTGHERYADLAL